jgi:dTDP-4-amino-4,6-dideoxygalactose transaminase
MVDLAARHHRLAAQTEAAVLDVLGSGRWVGGAKVSACEARSAGLFGRAHGVGVNSGTDAIVLGLMALGVQPGDQVIVPALSFFATAGAVCHAGATPVVADVSPDRPTLCPHAAQRAVGPHTKAAIPVHLFGMTCPDPGLAVPLIEDAAQAVGWAPPARLGTLTAASFYPTKTLGAAGDAGLVATDDPQLADALRGLANHGCVPGQPHLHHRIAGRVGINSRLDPIQAAMLMVHMDDLPRRVARRRAIAAAYDGALPAGIPALPRTAGDPVHHYLLRSTARDRLAAQLSERSVSSAIYYPRPLSAQPALAPQRPCPNADRWCAESLSVPCHAELSDTQVERVCSALQEFRP